ncbi:MAG: hypothetical protein QOG10_6898 [Kribbellaceae bacterium]|jgi:hypothetical protein|nr:hypothetical protein [Kribbellaceae bacterium]
MGGSELGDVLRASVDDVATSADLMVAIRERSARRLVRRRLTIFALVLVAAGIIAVWTTI